VVFPNLAQTQRLACFPSQDSATSTVYKLDCKTGTWAVTAGMQQARWRFGAATVASRIFAVGGAAAGDFFFFSRVL